MSQETDVRFMALALALGRRGLGNAWPNPAVGAVVVREPARDAVIVGRGWTQPGGRPHAETEALRRASAAASGATLYATLEPCSHYGKTPPCTDAIIAAGISRVVSAMEDPNDEVAGGGHALLRAHGITVDVGILADEARRSHAGHIRRIGDGRPNVTLKLAISADGKVALAGRRPVPITGEAARTRVHLMRAMNDAILIGIGTAMADDPLLTCRLPGLAARSPVRVVLDAALRLSPESALARSACETRVWIIAAATQGESQTKTEVEAERRLRARGVEVLRSPADGGRINLALALRLLAARGITRLMVEGGPRVAASFVAADLVDEACLVRSEKFIGTDGIDALDGSPLTALIASPHLRLRDAEVIDGDRFEIYERS
jgi:diaminohydroxyphosphoribosylaminopyrimidine deaminase/5-amino-6-(5-phosphoribosylamino)uracil reductase